jgi:hypothetical protein
MSKDFVRYFDAKTETDDYELKPNVNFYGIRTSSEASAVHIPTPVYKRSKSFSIILFNFNGI